MKIKYLFVICVAIAGFFLTSCEDEMEPIVESGNGKKEHDPEAELNGNLETMYMMQSNPELMLADRIISKGTVFVLDISKKEADELQIPGELYQKYVDKVSELNKQCVDKYK